MLWSIVRPMQHAKTSQRHLFVVNSGGILTTIDSVYILFRRSRDLENEGVIKLKPRITHTHSPTRLANPYVVEF